MLSILVIDDDFPDRMAIRRHLLRVWPAVIIHEAETGLEGLTRLRADSFDCVFLDYMLKDMDGISLLREIYDSHNHMTPAPIVMLTGQGSEALTVEALRYGAQDYLVKSNISPGALEIAIIKARENFELRKRRREYQSQLLQSQKMEVVGQLTSGLAHDFNNLLTIILGNTYSLMNMRLADYADPQVDKNILAIDKAAKKGARLVQRLMVFSRQRPLAPEVTNLNKCIEEVCELINRTLAKRIELRAILDPGLWPVKIDTGQFENAVLNMAVNARDAMPGGGQLTIETRNGTLDPEYTSRFIGLAPGPYVQITISDTGLGMAPDVKERLFEPFFTTKEAGEGTGLGMSMVYGLIRDSGGHIHVYSELNRGTTFKIYLPRHITEDAALPTADGKLPRGSETILLAEDDDRFRDVATAMLERLGYRVLAAANGPAALELFRQKGRTVGLLLSDLTLGQEMHGPDLVRHIRKMRPDIRVIYASGYAESMIRNYQDIRGEELIGKPFEKSALAYKIRNLLDSPQEACA